LRTIEFNGAERVTPEAFDALVTVPKIHGSDPVRGPVTVRKVFDYRPGRMEATEFVGAEAYSRPIVLEGQGERQWLRIAGWVAFLGLIAAFVVIRVHRLSR
jgi:hypothetical protein